MDEQAAQRVANVDRADPRRPPRSVALELQAARTVAADDLCSPQGLAQTARPVGSADGHEGIAMLLRNLATERSATEPVAVRYDPHRRISLVFEDGRWVPSFESSSLGDSKKCDLETGEDQKGQ